MKSISTIFTLVLLIAFTSSLIAQTDWTKDTLNNPILEPGVPGTWNDYSIFAFSILFNDGTYHMWYGGYDGAIARIGYASSTDGIMWTPFAGNPVLEVGEAGSWEDVRIQSPYVLFDGNTYHMWYTGVDGFDGQNYRIGYATSTNGVTWTKYAGNPVLDVSPEGTLEVDGYDSKSIFFDGSIYHMWYHVYYEGYQRSFICYATSPDGITWNKYDGNPVLDVGEPGSWDSQNVGGSDVFFDGTTYHMWYYGEQKAWESRIGYATSADGITWAKFADKPVLDVGMAGDWDSKYVGRCKVLKDTATSTYKMWYGGGFEDYRASIGYATAPVTINVPDDFETIQAAIDAAHNGNVVLVDEGTYYENINFKGKAITVASHFYVDGDTSHISKTIIDGSQPSNPDSGSVVYFISGEDTTSVLMGFTITNGTGTKGQYTVQGSTYDFRGGGGVACWNSGGRIVWNRIINNTTSDDNEVLGGGFGAGDIGSTAYVILERNQIKNNKINAVYFAAGGGVSLTCNGRLVDNIISYNSCTATEFEANGGGVKITTESASDPRTVIIKGNHITHNLAEGKKVSGHHGAKGGGIVNHYCKVIILDNEILYNHLNANESGDAYGSGIHMHWPNSGSLISCNTISNNTINENITSGGGGISLWRSEAPFMIINNIISENSALNGGGVYLNDINSEIINNTIVNNTVTTMGGGLYSTDSNPVVVNTIFWNNEATNGSQIYGSGNVVYSDIQEGWPGEGNIDINPCFSDSLFNLSDTSACVGNGKDSVEVDGNWYKCPSFDYYGNPRPYMGDGFVDIGAIESPFERVWLNISTKDLVIPFKFELKQNYPNPFNPSTTIEFTLPKSEFVGLKVFNILGKEVTTLVSNKLNSGNHTYTFDGKNLASGIYYYRIEAGEFQDVKKMILIK